MRTAWAADHILFNDGDTKFSNLSMVKSKNLHGMSMERPVTTSIHRCTERGASTLLAELSMRKDGCKKKICRQAPNPTVLAPQRPSCVPPQTSPQQRGLEDGCYPSRTAGAGDAATRPLGDWFHCLHCQLAVPSLIGKSTILQMGHFQ